jgi:hypothetical protein
VLPSEERIQERNWRAKVPVQREKFAGKKSGKEREVLYVDMRRGLTKKVP